ncbi:EAL domain-containing protein [Caenispirillum bisanense]|nr:EAL domain-containing protein [Caenispirillum bisanense]
MRAREGIQAERLLLDAIDRLRRKAGGGRAVHLHLSRLLPVNRLPVRIRVVARMFKSLETGHGANVYRLSNDDLVILGRALPVNEIDTIVHRVRSLFEHDPVTYAGRGWNDPNDPFVSWFDLMTDWRALSDEIARLEEARLAALQRQGSGGPVSPFSWSAPKDAGPEPIDPRALDRVLTAFEGFDITAHMRRQPAVRITEARVAEIAFEEFFVSIGHLQRGLAPDVVLTADRWLFQDFSRALDRRMLQVLTTQPLARRPGTISLNLNLESTRDPFFERFVASLGRKQGMVVEVQVIDVFADIAGYEAARDALREAGHKVLIDGLSPVTLRLLDVRRLDPDYAKVLWNADLASEQTADKSAAFAAEVKAVGPERVVLARCDTEAAVLWGLENGIRVFQGRFIDAVLGTVTMDACKASAQCSLSQCAGRRSAVAGPGRAACPNPPGLDAVQSFAAPGRRKQKQEGRR